MKRKVHFQWTLAAQSSFEKYGRKCKREQFLDAMNKVVPWAGLLALVDPHYPKAGIRVSFSHDASEGFRRFGLLAFFGASARRIRSSRL
jgi:hypothetical protein